MRHGRRLIWFAITAFGIVFLAPALAYADNCSSPGDCWGTAAAAAGAAVGAGAAAAAAAAGAKWETLPCERERDRVERSESARDFHQREVDRLEQQLRPIQAQAEVLKTTAIGQGTAALGEVAQGPPDLAEAVSGLLGALVGGLPGVTGGTPREFFSSLGTYYQQMAGQMGIALGMAQQGPFQTAAAFLITLQQVQQLGAQAQGLLGVLEEAEAKLREWKEEVQKARDSLAECEAGAGRGVL